MELEKIKSVEDLRNAGSISKLVKEIKSLIRPLTIEANTYDELFKIVCCLQKNWLPLVKGPFISKQAEFVYYLTQLEGKQRNVALGITDDLYEDVAKAKKWYKKISNIVHPDKRGSNKAFVILKQLYHVMIDVEESDDE